MAKLSELNLQVGDVVGSGRSVFGVKEVSGVGLYLVGQTTKNEYWVHNQEGNEYFIISRARKPSPVKVTTVTTTKKEIVPGVYGKVSIYPSGQAIGVDMIYRSDLQSLKETIATLQEILYALENP